MLFKKYFSHFRVEKSYPGDVHVGDGENLPLVGLVVYLEAKGLLLGYGSMVTKLFHGHKFLRHVCWRTTDLEARLRHQQRTPSS